MERHQPSAEKARIAELEAKLAEAEETLRAIHSGEVDALLVARPEGDQVFTLQGADTTYRFLVEEMNEGALLLGPEGTILYANARFAQLASVPLEQVIGSPWERFFVAADQSRLDGLLATARVAPVRQELYLDGSGGSARPVAVSLSSMQREQVQGFSAVVTDLSERKAAEGALRDANEKLELRVQQRTDQLTQANTLLLAEMGERKRTEEEVLRQREWLRVTLTSIGDAVIACDKDCRVTFINSAAVSLTGWQAEEAQGQPVTGVFKIINEVTGEPAENIMARVLREGRVLALANHTALVARCGRKIPVEDCAAPIIDAAGKVAGVVLVFHDVTLKRRAQEALRLGEERLRLAQRAGRVGVFDWDISTNRMIWTPELEEIFGLPPGSFENRYEAWAARVQPEDLPAVEQLFREWLSSNREIAEWEYRYVRQGEDRWIAARGQVFRDGTGKPVRMIGTKVDVTERKRDEAVLRRNREELERLVAERTAKLEEMVSELRHVSYSIVHDMRAPLRALQGFSSLLESECAGCPRTVSLDYFRRIKIASARMDHLITDALSYTKAVLENLPLGPVNVLELVRGLVDTYPNLHPDNADIRLEGDLPVVLGNEALVTQCFSNLLANAVKFVAPGVKPQVRVRAEVSEGTARIWVEDNGIGISKHAQGRLFGMFQRLVRGYEGTGIGLAIVRKVVQRMGGRVGVESEEGKGSRFWVELRAARSNDLPATPAGGSGVGS